MSAGGLSISPLGVELLDDPAADAATVIASLDDIAVANRWFGGTAAALHGLGRILAGTPPGTRVTLLDIGTGRGDLPVAAVRWGRRRGLDIVPVGLERSAVAAALAVGAGIPTVIADAAAPPVRSGSVDVVLVSQVAHHFAPASVIRLARTCDRLARLGVVVADLRRSGLAAAGFSLAARALGFDRVTRLDGVTSIRRGFTRAGMAALLAEAGVDARVERRPGSRLVATWRSVP